MFISLYSVLTRRPGFIKVYIMLAIQPAGGTLPDAVSRAVVTPICGAIIALWTEEGYQPENPGKMSQQNWWMGS